LFSPSVMVSVSIVNNRFLLMPDSTRIFSSGEKQSGIVL